METELERRIAKVVGVSFNNEDGQSRQEIIARLDEAYGEDLMHANIELEEYTYNDSPACRVLIDGSCIGNLSAQLASELYDLTREQQYTYWADTGYIVGGPEYFDGDEDDELHFYGVRLVLCLASPAARQKILAEIDRKYAERKRAETSHRPVDSASGQYRPAALDKKSPKKSKRTLSAEEIADLERERKAKKRRTILIVASVVVYYLLYAGYKIAQNNDAWFGQKLDSIVSEGAEGVTTSDPDSEIRFETVPGTVSRGDWTTVEIHAEPKQLYYIQVHAGVGEPLRSTDLLPAVASFSGRVSWSWKTPDDAEPGDYLILIFDRDGHENSILYTIT